MMNCRPVSGLHFFSRSVWICCAADASRNLNPLPNGQFYIHSLEQAHFAHDAGGLRQRVVRRMLFYLM